MKDIAIEAVLNRAGCLEVSNQEDKYNKSYFHFVEYFRNRQELTEHDLIIAANFTYGWMPTILNFKTNEFGKSVSILNQCKSNIRISDDDLKTLKKLINNSLVGTSKLLHFINPDVYAIWDSRVCKFLTGKSKVENIQSYWDYLDLCHRIKQDSKFLDIHTKHKNRVGFDFSPMRTIEQIMFINSNKPLL